MSKYLGKCNHPLSNEFIYILLHIVYVNDMPTTVQIEDELVTILDKIVQKTPRYRSRSDLVRQVLWDLADSFTNEE